MDTSPPADPYPTESSPAMNGTASTHLLPVVIAPGFHNSALTDGIVRSLPSFVSYKIVDAFAASPPAMYDWLTANVQTPTVPSPTVQTPTVQTPTVSEPPVPFVAIGFSAGVVGLAGALALWQQQRWIEKQQSSKTPVQKAAVARFIAVDGWGVPVIGVPITRMSHDHFTHVSSLPLGAGDVNFFASPAVEHLDMWREPDQVMGREVKGWTLDSATGVPMTAAEFLRRVLHAEWNRAFSWRN